MAKKKNQKQGTAYIWIVFRLQVFSRLELHFYHFFTSQGYAVMKESTGHKHDHENVKIYSNDQAV